ncbi:hypothetical protein FVE85_9701 [Porphyridium purpureum]|uniref:TLC domain-containing protein n=1 Tax=Porphyridium purpureum TaxID=35688 RepID=A0A5J4YLS9_PORPP|nr:hypothetical protein FVE85_9701 [Porphyridium purpureum]|eukprot:POR0886..scf246_12
MQNALYIALWVGGWQTLHTLALLGFSNYFRKRPVGLFPVRYAPSFFVAGMHALVISIVGLSLMVAFFGAPYTVKYGSDTHGSEEFHTAHRAVEQACCMFVGYLFYDLGHVLTHFPDLGGWDMLIHHMLFLSASLTALYRSILHFSFAWLIIGEISSVFLNLRWFLRKLNCSIAWLLPVNLLFALFFGVTRVLVYGVGLYDLVQANKELQSLWIRYFVFILSIGWLLNTYWFAFILRKGLGLDQARRNSGNNRGQTIRQSESSTEKTR